MNRKVLVLTFVIAVFGFGLFIPQTTFESITLHEQEQPYDLEYAPAGIGDNLEDFVDQISNLHLPTDIGTHSVFADLQDFGLNYNQMQEVNTGSSGTTYLIQPSAFTDVDSLWGTESNAYDWSNSTSATEDQSRVANDIYWQTWNNTGAGSISSVDIRIYMDLVGLIDDLVDINIYVNSVQCTATYQINSANDGTGLAVIINNVDEPNDASWSWTDVGNIEVRFEATQSAGPDTVADYEVFEIWGWVYPVISTNYELDLEVGWTTADFDETNEELCIYPVTGAGWPTEDIKVDVWNGAWTNVIADLTPDQWNNVSITSYLTGTAFEIRFLGGTETSDVTQDTWEIDAVLLHTWTPSYAPINDQAPTLDNPSDTDNMYAQYIEYQVTAYVSDQNGFGDIAYLELGIWNNGETTEYCRFRYDENTNTFSEVYDIGTVVSLNTGSSTATESGNDIDATFYFTVDWDFPDSSDLVARCFVIDTQNLNDTDSYSSPSVTWDVETRLDYTGSPAVNDGSGTADRGDIDSSFSFTGTIIYYTSADVYPSSAAVDVWVSASEYGTNVGPWIDTDLASGVFDVTCYSDDLVGQDTYTVKVVEEGGLSTDPDLYYTTSTIDTYIADRVQVQSYSVTDDRVNVTDNVDIDVTLYYEHDSSAVTDGTVTINGLSATHQAAGVWRITDSEASVMANTYDTVAYSGGTHGITTVDQNSQSQQVIWDQVIVISYTVVDNHVDINTVVSVNVTLQYDYDNSAVIDGTVTINGISASNYGSGVWGILPTQASVTAATYNLVAVSGNTHGITSINQNGQSQQVIWDQITVTGYSVSDSRANINANVNVDVTIEYAYDSSPVIDGTVTINGNSASPQGLGVWR
ncbi:MAG: hypothetical protein ACFFDM_08920, partial [Candidatus Thorarchaeota archaeon]